MAVNSWYVGKCQEATRRAVAYTVAVARDIQYWTLKGGLWPDSMGHMYYLGSLNAITTLEWEVRSVTEAGTLLANGTLAFKAGKDGFYPWRTITFGIRSDDPVAHSTGITYYLIIKSPSDTQVCDPYFNWAGDGAGSHKAYYGAAWHNEAGGVPYLSIPAEMAGTKYHLVIDDKGYMTPDLLRSFMETMAQSPIARLSVATKEHSDLAFPYSTHSQSSWHRGIGEYEVILPDAYWAGEGIDTLKERQLILAGYSKRTTIQETNPSHGPTTDMPLKELPSAELTTDPASPVRYFAQKFTAAATYAITKLSAYIRGWGGDGNVWLELWSDAAGTPSAMLRQVDLGTSTALGPAGLWRDGTITTYTTGGASEDLWLVIRVTGTFGNAPDAMIRVDGAGGASGGVLKYSSDGTTWTAWASRSLWFRVNDEECKFSAHVGVTKLIQAEFAGTVYLFALCGTKVYRWNETNGYWEDKVDFGAGIWACDAAFYDDKLWVSSTANTWYTTDAGANWTDSTVARYRLFVAQGFLWASGAIDHNLYKWNASVWSAAIVVGDKSTHITGICEYQGEIHAAKEDGVWYVDKNDLAYLRIPYPDQSWAWNGYAMMVWGGYLWINVQTDLWRWNGSRVDMRGPNQGYGLPYNLVGPILTLAGSAQYLFAGTYSHTGGYSTLLAYDGIGWHPIRNTDKPMNVRSAIWTADIGSEYRLWYGEGEYVRYMTWPIGFTNRFDWGSATYEGMGQLQESWWYGGLRNVKKHLRKVMFDVDGLSDANGTYIDVFYKLDNDDDSWRMLGTLSESACGALEFPDDIECFAVKLTFNLWTLTRGKTPRLRGWGMDAVARPTPVYQASCRILLADKVRDMEGTQETRTAQAMWVELKDIANKVAPVLVHHPWGSFRGLLSHLGAVPIRYKEAGSGREKWERAAEATFILVT